MSEDRKQILQMLAEGKVNADEAERLIAALEAGSASTTTDRAPRSGSPKYLRVMVDTEDGVATPTKVNIRVPMQLLRAGVRLSALIPAPARDQVNTAMRENG